jgi:hypothetical protein
MDIASLFKPAVESQSSRRDLVNFHGKRENWLVSANLDLIKSAFVADELFQDVKRGEWNLEKIYAEKALIDVRDFDTPGFDPVYVGHDAIRRFWMEWFAPWDSMTWNAEFYERGGWVVADVVDFVVKGEASGIELEMPHAQTYFLRGGLIDRLRIYQSRKFAFLEAGIELPA